MATRTPRWKLLGAVAASLSLLAVPLYADGANARQAAFESLQGKEALDHIKVLAADAMEGRDSGSKGERKAAEYIAEHFAQWGLQPVGDDGSYFQRFTIDGGAVLGKGNRLSVQVAGKQLDFEAGEDFEPFAFAPGGFVDAGLVFAGYGISAPDLGYDDYQGLDVEGKMVVILRHEPQQAYPESPFDGRRWSPHALFGTKVRVAQEHGAAGLIIVNDPAFPQPDSLIGLRTDRGEASIPVIHLTAAAGDRLMEAAGRDLATVQDQIDEDLEPIAFGFDGSALAVTQVEHQKLRPRNVVGFIEGSDPELKDEIVVIGGHYDHVGYGHYGSRAGGGEIHNGADDNASGTSAIMEVAQGFAESGLRPARSILFILFSGEERGLLGSQYYVENPIFSIDKTVAMINLDMVGREKLGSFELSGVGTSPIFPDMTKRIEEDLEGRLGHQLRVSYGESGVAPSDNTSFYRKDIPVLFFFTGLHDDYHAPGDDWDKINVGNLQLVTQMAFEVVVELSGAMPRPEFTKAEPQRNRRGGPFLGIQADRSTDVDQGVKIARTVPDSAAAKAGIEAGDVIVGIDGSDIAGMQDLVQALRKYEVGDEIEIVVLRGDEELTLRAKLGSR